MATTRSTANLIMSERGGLRSTLVAGLNGPDEAAVTVMTQSSTNAGELDIAAIYLDADGLDRLIVKLQTVRKLMES